MKLFINGRFLTQPMSGVQRYAHEILRALDQALAASPALQTLLGPVTVLAPRGAVMPNWQALRLRILSGGQGHIWEQGALYRASRGSALLSLCNCGPVRHQKHILAVHDAHIFEIPRAFSRPYLAVHRTLRPILARRAAALITVSTHAAGQLAHYLNVPEDRFALVPNAADHILRRPNDTAVPAQYGLRTGHYLLALGNQSPNKNLGALVEAHRAAGSGVPDLVIAGGIAPGILPSAVTEAERLHVLGRVPEDKLRSLYQGAAGFVFPSLHEGFGIPPLEAMTLGVPVICARRAAMPEVLGDAPLWFDPTKIDDITHALDRFAAMHRCERETRVALGQARAARYAWTDSAQALIDVIAGVMAPRASEALKQHVDRPCDLVRAVPQAADPSP